MQFRDYHSYYFRYGCGAAREFKDPDTEEFHPIQKMTCQWNTEWTPKPTIPVRLCLIIIPKFQFKI